MIYDSTELFNNTLYRGAMRVGDKVRYRTRIAAGVGVVLWVKPLLYYTSCCEEYSFNPITYAV